MKDPCWVKKLESFEDLIDEVLDMIDWKLLLGLNHATQVCFDQLADEIDVADHLSFSRNVDDVLQAKNVFMH